MTADRELTGLKVKRTEMKKIERFCQLLNDFYGEVFVHQNHRFEVDCLAEIEEAEQEGETVYLYVHFWAKYGQLVVDKGGARAGWQKEIRNSGITITFEIHFEKISMFQQIVTVDIFQRGHIRKVTLLINDEEVNFTDEYENRKTFLPDLHYTKEISPYQKQLGSLMCGTIENTVNILYKYLAVAFSE